MSLGVGKALTKNINDHVCLLNEKTNLSPNHSLKSILFSFKRHSLEEQSSAALMDRVDTKFILPLSSLNDFLSALKDDYTVLDENGCRAFTYATTYFDTPDRDFYHAHHNGKLNRNKVRFRHYIDTNTAFMEVKLKNNKQRTQKTRIALNAVKPDFEKAQQFLQHTLHRDVRVLETTLLVNYQRVTLMNKNNTERLTLDLSLSFEATNTLSKVSLPKLWIAEFKRTKKTSDSPVLSRLKQQKIYPVKFSKYCIGMALTDRRTLKINRFKSVLNKIENITPIDLVQ